MIERAKETLSYDLIRFTLEPCNFALNLFQDFVFTYFDQKQQCL